MREEEYGIIKWTLLDTFYIKILACECAVSWNVIIDLWQAVEILIEFMIVIAFDFLCEYHRCIYWDNIWTLDRTQKGD